MEDLISIIEKCIKAKNEKGYSYEYLADQTGISKSTIERIFKTKGAGCRYDSVAPIANFLACVDEPTPSSPKALEAQNPLGTNEMIEWYKEIIKERREENERLKEEIKELKAENKQNVRNLEKTNKILIIGVVLLLMILTGLFVVDFFLINNAGWFIK